MKWTIAIMLAVTILGGTFSSALSQDIAGTVSAERSLAFERSLPPIMAAVRDIEDEWQRINLLIEIAKAAFRIGGAPKAEAFLAEATEQARQTNDPIARSVWLTDIASAHAEIGAAETAKTLFAEAAAADPSDSALRELAATQAGKGQIASGLTLARSIGSAYYRAPALSAVAKVQAESGGIASSNALFNEAIATLNEIPLAGGLRATMSAEVAEHLAVARAQAGDLEGLKDIRPHISSDWPLRLVARALAHRGDFDNALLIAEDIGPAQQSNAQLDIVAELVAIGAFSGAAETADVLFPSGTVDHDDAAVIIATAQAKAGDPDGARATAADVLLHWDSQVRAPNANDPASLWTRENSSPAPAPSDGIARYLGKSIWNAADDDPVARRRDAVLAAISGAEAAAGNVGKALETMQEISTPMWRMFAFIDASIATDQPEDAVSAALSTDVPVDDRAHVLAHLIGAFNAQ